MCTRIFPLIVKIQRGGDTRPDARPVLRSVVVIRRCSAFRLLDLKPPSRTTEMAPPETKDHGTEHTGQVPRAFCHHVPAHCTFPAKRQNTRTEISCRDTPPSTRKEKRREEDRQGGGEKRRPALAGCLADYKRSAT